MRNKSIKNKKESVIKAIELSDATAFGTFLYYGTKAVTPDLIIYKGSSVSL